MSWPSVVWVVAMFAYAMLACVVVVRLIRTRDLALIWFLAALLVNPVALSLTTMVLWQRMWRPEEYMWLRYVYWRVIVERAAVAVQAFLLCGGLWNLPLEVRGRRQ